MFLNDVYSFWEKGVAIEQQKNNEYQDFFAGKMKSDLKKTLKNLNKYYTVILIFRSNNRFCKNLFHYLLKNNYVFDGAYYISGQQFTNNLALNYNLILKDYKFKEIRRVLIMDTLPNDMNINGC